MSERRLIVAIAITEASLAQRLSDSLAQSSFDARIVMAEGQELERTIHRMQPDAILVHADAPSRDTLENLACLHQSSPKPVVMLCPNAGVNDAKAAIAAGVSLYAVTDLSAFTIGTLVTTAVGHFRAHQCLHQELSKARIALDEREVIHTAKYKLMEAKHLSESDAYKQLRSLAMRRRQRLVDCASDVISNSVAIAP